MQVTLGDLFSTPDLHLFAFEGQQAAFLQMSPEAYRRSIFLDGRISPAAPQMIKVPLEPLLQFGHSRGIAPQQIGWIFHVAQCGSTLLGRALDQRQGNLVLREPMPLRQLAVEQASGSVGAGWEARLRLAATMAGRRYRSDLPAVVKGTVPMNFILPHLVDLDPAAPAIFLYFPLEAYLLAILRSPQHREWVRRVTTELVRPLGIAVAGGEAMDDAERAAALWLAQMRAFLAAMHRLPASRSLDAAMLFSTPRPVIDAAARLFGQAMGPEELDGVIAGDLFSTYSKNPSVAFDNTARLAREAEAARRLEPELRRARTWLESRLAEQPLPARLPRPLIGDAPPLL